jgi:hypothetical protein
MKEEAKVGILFSALIVAFAIPAWVPIIWNRKLWPRFRTPVIAITVSALVQLAFVNCVQTIELCTLDYSLRFAAVGIPCIVLAIKFARNDPVRSARTPFLVSSFLGLAMWLFLITAH